MSTGVIYPADAYRPFLPAPEFATEAQCFAAQGLSVYTQDRSGLRPLPQPGQRCLYRGFPLRQNEYRQLYADWSRLGILPRVTPEAYALCQALPNWYPLLRDWTPETHRLEWGPEICTELPAFLSELQAEGWPGFFLKDDVKALKTGTEQVSLLREPEEGLRWLQDMRAFRGALEGGVCIRRPENWLPASEERWLVWQGEAFGPHQDSPAPEPVAVAAAEIDSPFFAVDVIRNQDQQWRLIDLGDGQVSVWRGWHPKRLVEVLKT